MPAEFMHLMTVGGSRGIPPRAPAHRPQTHDLDQSGRSTAAQRASWHLTKTAFSVIEVARLQLSFSAWLYSLFVGFSILAEP